MQDMIGRRTFLASLAAASAWPLPGFAQPARRIGFLHPGNIAVGNFRISAFREGLGGEAEIVTRVAQGNMEKLPALTAELLALPVDLIVAVSPITVRTVKAATQTVPILAVDLESDPVASSFVASLARPGRNLTGIFLDFPEFSAKLLQLLREAVPSLSKIAVLWDPETGAVHLDAVKAAAPAFGIATEVIEIRRTSDFEGAFEAAGKASVDGVLILSSPLVSGNAALLADHAASRKLPAITLFPEFAQNGGLLGYGPDLQDLFRQGGVLARKMLHGAKPTELPVERPTRFRLVANLKLARQIGVNLPTSILLRADEVVE